MREPVIKNCTDSTITNISIYLDLELMYTIWVIREPDFGTCTGSTTTNLSFYVDLEWMYSVQCKEWGNLLLESVQAVH